MLVGILYWLEDSLGRCRESVVRDEAIVPAGRMEPEPKGLSVLTKKDRISS